MAKTLTNDEISIILESLKFSKKNIDETSELDYEIKKAKLAIIEDIEIKLKSIRAGKLKKRR